MAGGGKIHVDGYSFRSERELQVYWGLLKMLKDGRVSHLEVMPKCPLIINQRPVGIYQPSFTLYDVIRQRERVIQVQGTSPSALRDFKEAVFSALTGAAVEHWA